MSAIDKEQLRDLATELDDGSLYGDSSMAGEAIRELLRALEKAERQGEAALTRALELGDDLVDSRQARYRAEARIRAAVAILDEDARWQDDEHLLARVREALDGDA